MLHGLDGPGLVPNGGGGFYPFGANCHEPGNARSFYMSGKSRGWLKRALKLLDVLLDVVGAARGRFRRGPCRRGGHRRGGAGLVALQCQYQRGGIVDLVSRVTSARSEYTVTFRIEDETASALGSSATVTRLAWGICVSPPPVAAAGPRLEAAALAFIAGLPQPGARINQAPTTTRASCTKPRAFDMIDGIRPSAPCDLFQQPQSQNAVVWRACHSPRHAPAAHSSSANCSSL